MSTTYNFVSNDVQRQIGVVETLTGATTLTGEDSGKSFILNAAAGAQITLPAVATSAGFSYRFTVGALFATTAWTVRAASAVIQGGAIVNSVFVASANRNLITFAHAADTVGDFVELNCDGTNWYVSGIGAAAGAITFTTV
jgi:hypothetical protein